MTSGSARVRLKADPSQLVTVGKPPGLPNRVGRFLLCSRQFRSRDVGRRRR